MTIDSNKLQDICKVLDELYHSPRLGNKSNALSELAYILLTTKTGEKNFTRTYQALKERYHSWNEILEADTKELASVIRGGGLANQKAKLLQQILAKIKERSGRRISLSFLKKLPDEEVESYLLSLPGIGYKTAKCIMMYSLNRQVLPVDVHTYRLALELGLVSETFMRNEKGKLHKELEALIPPECRYTFHVNAIAHGRKEHRSNRGSKCQLVQLLESRQLLPLQVQA